MKKTIPETEKLYHIGLCKKQLDSAKIAILPGDPARVELLAKLLDTQSLYLSFNREYCSYLATVGKEKILVISTGMGCPSAAIAVEELAMLGIKKFIRVGTTGAIQEKINLGDLILNTGAVRLEGTSSHYVPIEYPAIADFELTQSLRQASQKLITLHLGKDTFWAGQERYDGYSGSVLRKFQGSLEEWQKLGLLNFEMEASALFTFALFLNYKQLLFVVLSPNAQNQKK